mgnify:CR=1 FL=1
MRSTIFVIVTIVVLLDIWFQRGNLVHWKPREKLVFFSLHLIVWVLSMMDLPYTPGLITLIAAIFKPFEGLVKMP